MDRLAHVRSLSDQELIARLKTLVAQEREDLADIIACLSEVKRRSIDSDAGFPHLFAYCVSELHYSEGAAGRRTRAVWATERFPEVLSYIAEGSLSLSVVARIANHLTPENRAYLLERACGKSHREVERLIAELAPRPDTADLVRRLPPTSSADPASHLPELPLGAERAAPPELQAPAVPPEISSRKATGSPERMRQLTVERVQFSFTASERFRMDFERARQLLRRKFPSGKLEDVFHAIVMEFLEREDPYRRIQKKRRVMRRLSKRAAIARKIPQSVRDQVWLRDDGRCAFISKEGRRCEARELLEFDHVKPWALGGRSDDPANVRLLCRTHNRLAARKVFGDGGLAPG